MITQKINQLDTASEINKTDLVIVGNPTTGKSYRSTYNDLPVSAATQDAINLVSGGIGNAVPSTVPEPNIVVYNVGEAGTYTNFDGIIVSSGDLESGLVQLRLIGSSWDKIITPIDLSAYIPKTDIVNDTTTGGTTKVLSAEQGKVIAAKLDSAVESTVNLDTSLYTTGATGTWASQSSIFNGWGESLPITDGFNGVRLKIRYWDITDPVTQVRILVRKNDRFGDIISDQTVPFDAELNEEKEVAIMFDTFDNVDGDLIWVEYNTDGKIGKALSPTNVTVGSTTRYRTTAMTGSTFADQSADDASNSTFYSELGVFERGVNATELFLEGISAQIAAVKAEIVLQSRILATQGVETNIYFDDIINTDSTIDQLNIDVTCAKGEQLDRCFRVTPLGADAGNHSITIKVSFEGIVLSTYTGVLVIKSASDGSASSKTVLCVGDSTTAGSQYIALVNTDYTPLASPSLTFIGTQGSGINKQEGYSGWRYSNFATSSASNPFWDTVDNEFDFQKYLTDNGFSMSSSDLITMHLGINDVFSSADNIPTILGYIDIMINGFRAAVPSVNIAICPAIAPAFSQDAFGDDYSNGQTLKNYMKNRFALIKSIVGKYDTDDMRTDKIWLFGFNHVVDRQYNFATAQVNANARNTTQITTWTNGVHPAQSGYEQMGDALYCGIKSLY